MRGGFSWGTDGAASGGFELPKVALEVSAEGTCASILNVKNAAFLIGSAHDCDLVLSESQFAEVHSCLLVRHGLVTIRHLGLGPALHVSGRVVTWAALANNDLIRTGPYRLRVRIEWPGAKPAASQKASWFEVLPGNAARMWHSQSALPRGRFQSMTSRSRLETYFNL